MSGSIQNLALEQLDIDQQCRIGRGKRLCGCEQRWRRVQLALCDLGAGPQLQLSSAQRVELETLGYRLVEPD